MIERLERALEHVAELPPEIQDDLAARIEELTEPLEEPSGTNHPVRDENLPKSVRDALAVFGAWGDLDDDDEFAALDRIRHESTPTPPIELDDL